MLDGDYQHVWDGNAREDYDSALICKNGHIINSMVHRCPEDNKKFCEQCGEPAISNCSSCNTPIRGQMMGMMYARPSFCNNCGAMFDWTKQAVETAIELAELEGNISDEEKQTIKHIVPEMIKDTPKTIVHATKFKKILNKVGAGAANAIRDVLVDIVSETARKALWD